jgi:ethanolamine permease
MLGCSRGMVALFNISLPGWLWWIILYAVFVLLNAAGASISFKFALIVAFVSIAILVVFAILAVFSGKLDFSLLFNIAPDAGQSSFLPHGWLGVLFALPFAMWFFLGIEELPLAAEEAHNPAKDIPRAGIWGMITLVACAAIVLVLNPAVPFADKDGLTGAAHFATAGEPLLDGFRSVLPAGLAAVLSAFALIGLLASLQGIMFAYGRNMYSLSRAGYYPKFLSLTGKRQTPWVALLVGAFIGFLALLAVDFGGAVAGPIVLNIAVWGAVLAYLLQMASFVVLRRRFPSAKRPYVSPTGVWGAVVAGVIAAGIFVGFLLNATFLPAIVAIFVVYVVMLALFALFGRKRLVLSPEEEYALSGGLHGDPQAEGYDAMETEVFGAK